MSEVQQLGNHILEIEDIGERLRVGYSSYCNACYPITHTPVLTLTDKMCKSVLFWVLPHPRPPAQSQGRRASSRDGGHFQDLHNSPNSQSFPELSVLWRNSHREGELALACPCNFLLCFSSSWASPSVSLKLKRWFFFFFGPPLWGPERASKLLHGHLEVLNKVWGQVFSWGRPKVVGGGRQQTVHQHFVFSQCRLSTGLEEKNLHLSPLSDS